MNTGAKNAADDIDRRLVSRVVATGDTGAFGELMKRHQSQVRNFLRKLTRDFELAEDLSQECFLHAWGKLHTYSGSGTVIGWLLRVAYTTFLQSKRKSKRYEEILEQVGHQDAASDRQTTEASDEITDLDRFLAALEPEERAVMILSYACGLSHREISEVTALPIGTAKSIIFRAKEKLRTRFDIQSHQHG